MDDTYRKTFSEPARAEEYDRVDFRPHSYGSLLWEMEKQMLEEVVGELRATHEQVEYLDFASGFCVWHGPDFIIRRKLR